MLNFFKFQSSQIYLPQHIMMNHYHCLDQIHLWSSSLPTQKPRYHGSNGNNNSHMENAMQTRNIDHIKCEQPIKEMQDIVLSQTQEGPIPAGDVFVKVSSCVFNCFCATLVAFFANGGAAGRARAGLSEYAVSSSQWSHVFPVP
jgi:hypothetical protein